MNINPQLLLPIVAKLSEAYTSKESTSISYEIARQLMGAVLYCLEEYEQTNEAVNEIRNLHSETSLLSSYEQGYRCVIEKVRNAKDIYNSFIPTFQSYDNWFLEDTIKKGMPAFFLYYDAKFNPQNHILTLDYSTIKSTHSLCGVDAIYQYLTYIQLEQNFLSFFPMEYVISILREYQEDYKKLPINVCEIVYHHLLACSLVGKKLNIIYFTKEDIQNASDYLISHTRSQIEENLSRLTKHFINKAYQENLALFNYLTSNIPDFTTELLNAAKNDCLHTIFYTIK